MVFSGATLVAIAAARHAGVPVAQAVAALAEMAYQANGYRRLKNPRIWSLHDLAALSEPRG